MYCGCVTKSCMKNANVPRLGAKEVVWFHKVYAKSYEDGKGPHYNPFINVEDYLPFFSRGVWFREGSDSHACNSDVVTAKSDILRDDGLIWRNILGAQCS
jgi:hypothetical protein